MSSKGDVIDMNDLLDQDYETPRLYASSNGNQDGKGSDEGGFD